MDIKISFTLNTEPIETKPQYSAYDNGFIEGEFKISLNGKVFSSTHLSTLQSLEFN